MKENIFIIREDNTAEIVIKRNNGKIYYCKIDVKDYNTLLEYRWKLITRKDGRIEGVTGRKNGKGSLVLLHRLLLNPNKNQIVDHVNGNVLDNRRINLRITDYNGNNKNVRIRKDNTSGYRGVHYSGGKYIARIQYNKKRINLGKFDTAKEAGIAYNEAAIKYHKQYARLNEIK